jgi:hypothetical protein
MRRRRPALALAGFPLADPIIDLLITVAILVVLKGARSTSTGA